jgi:hypothetical protein
MTLRSKRFLVRTAAVSALAEPAGAIIGLLVVGARPSLNGHFLAFAAGAMIFVSFHELLPMARRYGRMSWFLGGFLVGVSGHTLLESVTVSALQPRSLLSSPQTTPAAVTCAYMVAACRDHLSFGHLSPYGRAEGGPQNTSQPGRPHEIK